MKEALFYTKLDSGKVRCRLCAHGCLIRKGASGFCGARLNADGSLYALNYSKLVAMNADPVEKKPLYHFLPGTSAFSIASAGCNFRCGFCQNWSISQAGSASMELGQEIPPASVVKLALEYGCKSIAYTYTEPTVYFEFVLDTARLAREAGLYNIFVSNGYISCEAARLLYPYLDAANIDLKFFQDSSYKRICSARLAPVMESIAMLKDCGVWLEISTLVIPGENDSPRELSGIAGFIAGLDRDIPWHVCRFHADYKFVSRRDTPETMLKTAFETGKEEGLRYVYAGNTHSWGQDTLCPSCGKTVIHREGFGVRGVFLNGGQCAFCGGGIAGFFARNKNGY